MEFILMFPHILVNVNPRSDHGSQSTERSDFIQSVRIDGHLV